MKIHTTESQDTPWAGTSIEQHLGHILVFFTQWKHIEYDNWKRGKTNEQLPRFTVTNILRDVIILRD